MGQDRIALTDGGIETSLLFHEGFELPCFAAFPLVDTAEGRAAMRRYYAPFLELARDRDVPIVLAAPTWRRATRLPGRPSMGGSTRRANRHRATTRSGQVTSSWRSRAPRMRSRTAWHGSPTGY